MDQRRDGEGVEAGIRKRFACFSKGIYCGFREGGGGGKSDLWPAKGAKDERGERVGKGEGK